jgi:putative lumazine-binding protein
MKRLILVVITVAVSVGPAYSRLTVSAQEAKPSDRDAVKAAVLDYVEGIYQAQPERIQRSVHPDLAKRGYYKKKGETAFTSEPMTFDQLVALAGRWNKDGKRPIATYPKEVVVFDVLDQTASAKVTAMWGVDYCHLAKYDGRWKIVNILWQEPPPK